MKQRNYLYSTGLRLLGSGIAYNKLSQPSLATNINLSTSTVSEDIFNYTDPTIRLNFSQMERIYLMKIR